MPDVIRRLSHGAELIVRSRMGQLTCLQEQAHSKAGVCPEQFGSACLLYNSNSVGTKGETMLSPRILRGLIFILWLATAAANVLAQNSRASSAASYLERGASWLAKGEIERAIADYDLAIAFDARSALAYYNRAVARQRKGDLDGAVGDYDRAIELNPRYEDTYLNRGVIRDGQGERAAGINDFSRVIEFNPRQADTYCGRGVARLAQGKLEE